MNGEDFHSISHTEARAVFSRISRLVRITLLRETHNEPKSNFSEGELTGREIPINIMRPHKEPLGIKVNEFDI